jgi:hypothetical protein
MGKNLERRYSYKEWIRIALNECRNKKIQTLPGWDGIDLIDLAQNMDQWRALMNTVMNFQVP